MEYVCLKEAVHIKHLQYHNNPDKELSLKP